MKQKLITFITIIITITLFSCKQEISIDETPPSDITSFTATAMDSKILLSWTNPEDEDFAGIEVSCEPKTGSLENPVTLKKDVTSLFVYELENGTEYTFTVKSFDSSGNFSAGVTSTGTPIDSSDKTAPVEVTDFTATAMDSKILLSWTNPEDEDFAGIEVSCEPKAGSLENPVTLKKDVTSLFVYELENGTEYTFTVKSFDSSGNFSAGVTSTGTPIDSSDKTPPKEATDFSATAMDSKILLSWTEPEDEDFGGVEISCEPKVGSLENPVTLKKDVTSLFVYELENGTEYTFTIKSFDTSGNFSAGTTCTGTPIDSSDKTPPADVTDFSATAMDSKILLSWTNPEDEDFAGIEVSCEPKTGSLENPVTLKKDVTSLFVSELENGTEYTFTIKSFDTSGNFSSGVTSTGTPIDSSDKTPPKEATDFSATAMDSKILLSWTEPEDEDFGGVEISCEPKAGSLENPATLKKGVSSLIVYGLENGTEYTFTIKTFDTSGNFSTGVTSTGTPVDSSDKTPPSTPSDFTAEAMDSAVKLSWIDATDEDFFGYELTWTPKSSASVSRAVTGMKADSIFVSPTENERNEITISNLLNGTEYTFTLKSMDTSGNKSEGVIAKGTPTATPDVSRLTAIYYDGKTHISWTNPSGISGVEIFADGKKVSCDVKTVSSSVYGKYSYCILENSQPGKSYIVKTKNQAGQLSGGMAVSAVETGLPMIAIDTTDNTDIISKEDYVNMNISVWDNTNSKNSFSLKVSELNYGIRRRGNTSYGYPQKPYRIKFNKKTSMFGLKKAKSWVLLSNWLDSTMLVNDVAFKLGQVMELPFTNHGVSVDFILNGKYLGTYFLTEQVQVDAGRVDINEDEGILAQLDVYYDEEPKFKTTNYQLPVMIKNPELKNDDISLLQTQVDLINTLDAAVYNNGEETVADNLWTEIADVSTFAKFLMCNQIVKNSELGHPKSTYFYRDKDGTFCMGPLWDFDWAYGKGGGRTMGAVTSATGDSGRCAFFRKLYNDDIFKAEYKSIWEKYKDNISDLTEYMEEQKIKLQKSAELNSIVWGSANNTEQIDMMIEWWTKRIEWIDSYVNEL